MNVLVVGATGKTGVQIVTQAVAQGHQVTALVRDPDKAKGTLAGARLVRGDIRAAGPVAEAVAGQDAVVSALGSAVTLRRQSLLSDGTQALIDAMKQAGMRRLVCITGVGAGDSRGHGGLLYDWVLRPVVLRQVYADKDRQEEVVRASGLDWVLVRPGLLTDGPRTGTYRALTDLSGVRKATVSRADVADFVLKQLAGTEFVGQTPVLTA